MTTTTSDQRPLHVKIPVRDELTGWKPDVVKLYLGGVGKRLQWALRDVDLSLL